MSEETEGEGSAIDVLLWITPSGNIGRGRELTDFSFQLEAEWEATSPSFGSPITFTVSGGIFPDMLSLSESGSITGTITDMDGYVPEFAPPEGFVIAQDGSNYGTYGSALAGTYDCTFTVTISGGDATPVDRDFTITVINCYTSDGTQFIIDYTNQYGTVDPNDGEIKMFTIEGIGKVTAQEYIDHLRNEGGLQPCNH